MSVSVQNLKPIIMDELTPEFVGKNRVNLGKLAAGETQSERPGGSRDAIDGLPHSTIVRVIRRSAGRCSPIYEIPGGPTIPSIPFPQSRFPLTN
jgi:hypothetical protein